jgi:hypothetical protein
VARSFVHELAAFDRKVAGLSSPVATGVDGLRAIEIACAAEHLGAADVVGPRA